MESVSPLVFHYALEDRLYGITTSKDDSGDDIDSYASSERTRHAVRRLTWAIILTCLFVVIEMAAGIWSGSLAVLSDAAHMSSDLASFMISLFAVNVSTRQIETSEITRKMAMRTFGLARVEALGAMLTLILLYYITGVLLYLAIHRLRYQEEFDVESSSMMYISIAAIVFNLVLAWILSGHGHSSHIHSHGHHSHTQSSDHLNVRAALMHVVGDLIQSVGILISSVVLRISPSAKIIDPMCTILFSVIVVCTTRYVLKDSLSILMENAPHDVDMLSLAAKLNDFRVKVYKSLPNKTDVATLVAESATNLHVWSLSSTVRCASCHIVVKCCFDAAVSPDLIAPTLASVPHLTRRAAMDVLRSEVADLRHVTVQIDIISGFTTIGQS